MKKLFLLLILISSHLFAQYTTPNTGVNWSLDDLVTNSGGVVTGSFPNYAISAKVTIAANDRVYINPGTTVLFSGSTSGFDIGGKFWAVGTASDSIIFSSLSQDSSGSYNGLYFMDSSVDTACMVSYARIEYASYSFRCLGASPTLTNSYIWKSRRGPYLQSGSNPTITHNRIERVFEYGIYVTTGSSPLIEWNELINNNSQNTSPKNQITVGTQNNNSPTIRHNIIRGGMFIKAGGISISTLIGGSSSSSEIAFNEIYNNSFGITMTGAYPITCYVHDNIIYNNNINPDVMAAGSGINVYGTAVVTPIISRNKIYGNWWGVTIQVGVSGQPAANPKLGNIENADTTDDGQNIIFDNIQGTNVYDLYNNTPDPIYAQNNDWGVYDSVSIEEHIVHFVDDSTLGLVKFMPFSSKIPVELTSFTAEYFYNEVVLKWQTATETNNSGFEIERSQKSGVRNNNDWTRVSFVEGKGTTTNITEYYCRDKIAASGKYFYRLKQIDFDGSIKYSNEIEVDVTTPKEFSLYQNYPNPFNPTTTIRFALPVESRVKINIYNSLGQLVETLADKDMKAGYHEINFNASGLASGVYFYKLTSGNFVETRKMLLMK